MPELPVSEEGVGMGDRPTQYNQVDALRHIAELQIEQSTRDIASILEQHGSDYKWITASLLLLNSGGAVAILNTEYISVPGKIHAGAALVIGMIFALSVAWLSQIITPKFIHPIMIYRGYWIKIFHGHEYDEREELSEVEKVRKQRQKVAWPVPAAGWLSLISFLCAMFFAGQNIVSKNPHPPSVGHTNVARQVQTK